jgi:hypothetical protein
MLMKLKKLYLNVKLLIICLCEDGSSSKSETGGQYGLTSSVLFTVKYNDCLTTISYAHNVKRCVPIMLFRKTFSVVYVVEFHIDMI